MDNELRAAIVVHLGEVALASLESQVAIQRAHALIQEQSADLNRLRGLETFYRDTLAGLVVEPLADG